MADSRCPDCAVEPGTEHTDGCDVARCLETGLQRLSCLQRWHDCGNEVWSGTWPGEAECREYGLFAYLVPNGNPSWRPCGPDHPEAVPDLNRLIVEGWWDREARRWRWPRGQ